MNDNIDLTKILKDCPKGTKFYSPIFGYVEFIGIRGGIYPIDTSESSFTKEGFMYSTKENVECLLFPSKEQRDWNKFTAPWYNKKKFNKSKNNVHFYVARDLDGSLYLYIGMPRREGCSFNTCLYNNYFYLNDRNVCKYFGLNKDNYTNLKWEDDPVEVFINMED